MALFGAMAAASAAGLLAWGPIGPPPRLNAAALDFSDAIAALLPALVAAGGFAAFGRSRWPAEIARPWRLFCLLAAAGSLLAVVCHLAPAVGGYRLVQVLMVGAFTALLAGFLAERVHPAFGSRGGCAIALGLPLLAALWSLIAEARTGHVDLRGLLLLQALPILLLPAGALALPGRVTGGGDWAVLLLLYGAAGLFGMTGPIDTLAGRLDGHSLMHLLLAALALWLGYRFRGLLPAPSAGFADSRSSHRVSSARTSG